ncbi:hypothetical protein LMG18091_02410 [Ralstonia wenshanensis]|uniref:Uncharacterized protein n=1 Tax=Ralstonia wenshanensis TaxID=2842456 RepID=A0AAD2B6S7_9RALS|nr:hypothetical protein LMG18091_02410 [Ralstonia wenshanensis]
MVIDTRAPAADLRGKDPAGEKKKRRHGHAPTHALPQRAQVSAPLPLIP